MEQRKLARTLLEGTFTTHYGQVGFSPDLNRLLVTQIPSLPPLWEPQSGTLGIRYFDGESGELLKTSLLHPCGL